jgi:hypothetical protein
MTKKKDLGSLPQIDLASLPLVVGGHKARPGGPSAPHGHGPRPGGPSPARKR